MTKSESSRGGNQEVAAFARQQIAAYLELTGVSLERPREVRLLGGKLSRTLFGLFSTVEALTEAVVPYIGNAHLYIGVNATDPKYLHRANNQLVEAVSRKSLPAGADLLVEPVTLTNDEVTRFTALYLDFDAIRATKSKDCATDVELKDALEVRDLVASHLAAIGITAIKLMSGNGGNLLVLLSPEVPASHAKRIKAILVALKKRYARDSVEVDVKVGNSARLMRLPGGLNIKDESPGRPRRYAQLDHVGPRPQGCDLVSIEAWLGITDTQRTKSVSGVAVGKSCVTEREYRLLLCAWEDATVNGERHELALGLAGAARKAGHGKEAVLSLVSRLTDNAKDEEATDRLTGVTSTYDEPIEKVAGWSKLRDLDLKQSDFPSLDSQHAGESNNESQATALVAIGRELPMLRDQYDDTFVHVEIRGGRRELHSIRGRRFARHLAGRFFRQTEKAVGAGAVAAAVNVLDALAVEQDQVELWNRVARQKDGSIWLDLHDSQGRAVRIDGAGWAIQDSPALFRHYAHQKSIPEPVRGGNFWGLWEWVPISNHWDKVLFVIASVVSLIPDIPHPISVLHGGQGTSKTFTASQTRSLFDPSSAPTMHAHRDTSEFIQALAHNYRPIIDNISSLSQERSNLLCQASTGAGFSKRRLFTDDDDQIYRFTRPIAITCLTPPSAPADFYDRVLMFEFDLLPQDRLEEQALRSEFEKQRPQILGGMLDALVQAIKIYPTVPRVKLPRLVDFGRWAIAVGIAMGIDQDSLVKALWANVDRRSADLIDTSMIASAIVWLVRGKLSQLGGYSTAPTRWEGTPTALLKAIAVAPGVNETDKKWPRDPAVLGRRLVELKSPLLDLGVNCERSKSGDRLWTIEAVR